MNASSTRHIWHRLTRLVGLRSWHPPSPRTERNTLATTREATLTCRLWRKLRPGVKKHCARSSTGWYKSRLHSDARAATVRCSHHVAPGACHSGQLCKQCERSHSQPSTNSPTATGAPQLPRAPLQYSSETRRNEKVRVARCANECSHAHAKEEENTWTIKRTAQGCHGGWCASALAAGALFQVPKVEDVGAADPCAFHCWYSRCMCSFQDIKAFNAYRTMVWSGLPWAREARHSHAPFEVCAVATRGSSPESKRTGCSQAKRDYEMTQQLSGPPANIQDEPR